MNFQSRKGWKDFPMSGDSVNMGSRFALAMINKLCIFPPLLNEFEM